MFERHPRVVRVARHDHHHRRIDHKQILHHAHNLVFLPIGRSSSADEFGGLAEEGMRAGGGDFTGGFAAAHH